MFTLILLIVLIHVVLMQVQSYAIRYKRATNLHMKRDTVDLGMGCFWKPQQIFDATPGVLETYVGYTGKSGTSDSVPPTYQSVCRGDGHIEAVRVVYDDEKLSFNDILDIFLKNQDINEMRNSYGSQYTSAIYTTSTLQTTLVKNKLNELANQKDDKPKYIILDNKKDFYLAENYHQKYELKQPLKLLALVIILFTNLSPNIPTELDKLGPALSVVEFCSL